MSAWASQSQKYHVVCGAYQLLVRPLLDRTTLQSVRTSISVSKSYKYCQCQRWTSIWQISLLPVLLKVVTPMPVPKHGLTSTGRPLHIYMLGEVVFLQCCLSKFQSSKGPWNEQIPFRKRNQTGTLLFFCHLQLLRTFPKAMFTRKYHLLY